MAHIEELIPVSGSDQEGKSWGRGGGVCYGLYQTCVFFLLLLVSNQSSCFNSIARLLCNLKYLNFSHLEIFLSLLGL